MDKFIEILAEIEHEQWVNWSKNLFEINPTLKISAFLLYEEWKKRWVPYSELEEKTKDIHRYWARKVEEKVRPMIPTKEWLESIVVDKVKAMAKAAQ